MSVSEFQTLAASAAVALVVALVVAVALPFPHIPYFPPPTTTRAPARTDGYPGAKNRGNR